ncbi:putative monooxygenase [Xylariales sp. AK1849]|nr:putative monooxygenase [Xylariales sp. AK1849]
MAQQPEPETFGLNIAGDKLEFDPARWEGADRSRRPKRHPETGVDVLVVGAGMGGLMTALECWRKGHSIVGILERNEGPVYSGDIIAIMPSVASILRYWPDMQRDLEEDQVHVDLTYETHTGKHIFGPTVPSFNDPEHLAQKTRDGPVLAAAQIRQRFYRMLLRQVAKLGLRIEYGKRVGSYFEDDVAGKGGVVLSNGQVRLASVVVAADGIRSPSELLIAGEHTPTTSSGMSIYRCSYPRSLTSADPTVRERWGVGRGTPEPQAVPNLDSASESKTSRGDFSSSPSSSSWEFWLGRGMYMGIFMGPDLVAWGFTPREQPDGEEATESWEPDVDPDTVADIMLRAAPDWHPAVTALVRTAPKGAVVHWPLRWRNLRREWTSTGGRVVQVGDSAHTFTPTSGNGATQAIEDAITLATCLQLGGRHRVSQGAPYLATKVYNLLRYERVSCAQKMSFVNAELKTETNWDAIWSDPAKIRTRFPVWIFKHDPEAYAYEKYGPAFAHLVSGWAFQNTNIPPGHKCEPWTIEQLYEDIRVGKRMEDLLDGDWS